MTTKVDNQVFNILYCKRQRCHALLKYFNLKTYQNEYQMDKNGNTCSEIGVT